VIINPYDKKAMQAAAFYAWNKGKVVGLTSGTFDLPHDYHLRYLERCRRQCDVLVVGVDSDRAVREAKGDSRPIMSEFQRLVIIEAFRYVSFAYIQEDLAAFTRVAEHFMPDSQLEGRVFRNELFRGRESEVAIGKAKASVVIVPDIMEPCSTSLIVKRVKEKPDVDNE
jgi:D-beta-D-heptose 7-phosphate kinase/D-beta-D-heptose 1-phosphate adenosyltransferase